MKNILTLLILIIGLKVAAQNTRKAPSFNSKNWIPKKDTLIEIKSKNLIHVGKVAKINNRTSIMKIGVWKTYNKNKELIAEGEYKIGTYTYCDMVPNREFYHYKTGVWKFYNTYDIPYFELEFIPKKHVIPNGCENGDTILLRIIERVPNMYYEKINADVIYNLQKVVYHEFYGIKKVVPLNGKGYILII